MHASCSICGDIFTGVHPEVVHSTSCGHIFHYTCLLEWLQRSKTCPHCRSKVTDKNTIRLYFQLSAGVTQDTGTLENKVQSLTFQLALKETDLKKLTEEAKSFKEQNKGLRSKVLKSEEKIRNNETVVSSLQEQIKILKVQMKSLKEAQLKAEELEAKLEQFKSLEKVLSGSASEAAETLELMKDITDTSVLCACINTLKREMHTLKETTKYLQSNLKVKETKIMSLVTEVSRLENKISILTRTVEKLKDDSSATEQEHERLKKKNEYLKKAMLQKIPEDNAEKSQISKIYPDAVNVKMLHRLMNESPAPRLLESSSSSISLIENSRLLSPTSPLRVRGRIGENKNLVLSRPRWVQKLSTSDLSKNCYDGFGGHGNDDEEFIFTDKITPRKNKNAKKTPVKRFKPSTTNAAVNFKSRLDNFFTK